MKPGRAATFFYAAAIALVCPTAKPRLEWLALNRPNWLPFKPALTEAGTIDGQDTEVVSGLAAGDQVVVTGAATLAEGTKVAVTQ